MKRVISVLVALAIFPPIAPACLWDHDTLAMEKARFPTAAELITGRFARHSSAFYEWRIRDREKKLAAEPNRVQWFDDLAVAHDKLGRHDTAIELMLRKEAIRPGLYETYANLGTFYVHSGRYAEGLEYINRAIAINPEAHFGREVYQRDLVEFVMSRLPDGKPRAPLTPLQAGVLFPTTYTLPDDFRNFVLKRRSLDWREDHPLGHRLRTERQKEIRRAIKGILGMMRFGNHQSPVLLEALADLLNSGDDTTDAKQLSAWALLRASQLVSDEMVKQAYRQRAELAISMHHGLRLSDVETQLERELARGEAWRKQLERDEQAWIASGKDPEAEFARKYYKPKAPPTKPPTR